jgi:hypothetical protein
MRADVLRSSTLTNTNPDDPDAGEWVLEHDPDSNEIIRVWKPADNVETPEDESGGTQETFPCEARGIIEGGTRSVGTTESFGDLYQAVDYIRISFPANVVLTRRDQVTNIRDRHGKVLWVEEERTDLKPTVFNVVGVTPIIVPFVGHTENVALLERAETQ